MRVSELEIIRDLYRSYLHNTLVEQEISSDELREMLMENWNLEQLHLFDGKYVAVSFSKLMSYILKDNVRFKHYKSEVYDCDNFALSFAGIFGYKYGLNSIGIAVGEVQDTSGKVLYYHAWNVMLATKLDGSVALYMYEPQNSMFTSYKSGRILNKKYVPKMIIWG